MSTEIEISFAHALLSATSFELHVSSLFELSVVAKGADYNILDLFKIMIPINKVSSSRYYYNETYIIIHLFTHLVLLKQNTGLFNILST